MVKPRLQRLGIENFKAFRRCELELAPLTVLIGENSSGKTSLLQALLLLKQTLEGPAGKGVLTLNSHYVQFHQFREIVFGMPSDKAQLAFSLEFDTFKIDFRIGHRREGDLWPELLEFHLDGQPLPVNEMALGFEEFQVVNQEGWPSFAKFLPPSFIYSHHRHYKALGDFFKGIGYIQPLRPPPERYYELRGIRPAWIGIQGENIADFLAANPEVKALVRDWFVNSARIANEVTFESDDKRSLMEIFFTETATGLDIDISRLGFGYSQMLPIVVAIFSNMNMLIFEAPEIHLNPNLHGVLTDLFIRAATEDKQLFVETHSEHVIYRIQRRIAEGVITPKDVAIYYLQRGVEGSTADRLVITANGEIPDWPEGFFEAEAEDMFARVLAETNHSL